MSEELVAPAEVKDRIIAEINVGEINGAVTTARAYEKKCELAGREIDYAPFWLAAAAAIMLPPNLPLPPVVLYDTPEMTGVQREMQRLVQRALACSDYSAELLQTPHFADLDMLTTATTASETP
jgi:hypothetical protein